MSKKEELLKKEDIKNLILDVAGRTGLEVAKKLPTDSKLSEFKLAEQLDMEVNDVRSILYKLYNYNFVSYDKRRDEEKGWYIYHWKLLVDNIEKERGDQKQERLDELEERKKELESNQFFRCEECKEEYKFSEALEHNFLCKKCDGRLKEEDKTEEINKIKEKIEELKGQD